MLVAKFAHSCVEYLVRFWIEDVRLDDVVRSRVRLALWYAIRRAGWEFPFPVSLESAPSVKLDVSTWEGLFQSSSASLLNGLPEAQRAALWQCSKPLLFAPGERIIEEGAEGSSMFLLLRGRVRVLKSHSAFRAELQAGEVFGELSFLTGNRRSAQIEALDECMPLEFEARRLSPILQEHPDLLEALTQVGAQRAQELLSAETALPSSPPAATNLVGRIREFFRSL